MPESQVIVTGASKGIGAAIARELDRRGLTVAGLSRTGEVPAGYGLSCDVCDEASIATAIEAIAAKGPISGLVNCAGAHTAVPTIELETADFEHKLRLNATAMMPV